MEERTVPKRRTRKAVEVWSIERAMYLTSSHKERGGCHRFQNRSRTPESRILVKLEEDELDHLKNRHP